MYKTPKIIIKNIFDKLHFQMNASQTNLFPKIIIFDRCAAVSSYSSLSELTMLMQVIFESGHDNYKRTVLYSCNYIRNMLLASQWPNLIIFYY